MKKFLIKLSYTVLPVFLLLFGLVAYISLYLTPRLSGDLGNLAYIPFNVMDIVDPNELDEVYYETIDCTDELQGIHANVLTIGDSFAQQGRLSFENYLPGEGLSVVNCNRKLYDNPLQYAYNLLNMALVDSTQVDVMVVEIGERDFINRIKTFNVDKVELPATPLKKNGTVKPNSNSWSLLRARDFLMYRFLGKNPVYSVDLDRDYFDSKEPRRLYFYSADITNGVSIPVEAKTKIMDVYTLMRQKSKEQGIGLIFLIPVDKYDLYQKHIVANPYPPKTVNGEIRAVIGEDADFIICKEFLQPLIDQGTKDLFLFDDSHWSYKASEVVGHELCNRVKVLMNK